MIASVVRFALNPVIAAKKNKEDEQIKEIKEENWKNTAAKISDRLREENEILLKIKNEKKEIKVGLQ